MRGSLTSSRYPHMSVWNSWPAPAVCGAHSNHRSQNSQETRRVQHEWDKLCERDPSTERIRVLFSGAAFPRTRRTPRGMSGRSVSAGNPPIMGSDATMPAPLLLPSATWRWSGWNWRWGPGARCEEEATRDACEEEASSSLSSGRWKPMIYTIMLGKLEWPLSLPMI